MEARPHDVGVSVEAVDVSDDDCVVFGVLDVVQDSFADLSQEVGISTVLVLLREADAHVERRVCGSPRFASSAVTVIAGVVCCEWWRRYCGPGSTRRGRVLCRLFRSPDSWQDAEIVG
jgi:hypothetical protein